MTTLCFDFGNTRLKAAVFQDDRFAEEVLLENDSISSIEKILSAYNPQKTILSSVINHNPETEEILASRSRFHLLSSSTLLNFTTPVGKPETIGADRLALCAAAVHFFPGKNNLVIGLGTCITYNFINQYHQFLGGLISPGMDMRFRSMHDYTAKLPLVKEEWNIPLIGYDTKTNLQSGVIYGIIGELDGIIEQYENRYGNFNVVLTGGNSAYFASQLKKKIFADLNFLYKGLYALSEINN
jgi:type III pantothenate kinase